MKYASQHCCDKIMVKKITFVGFRQGRRNGGALRGHFPLPIEREGTGALTYQYHR